MQSTVGFTMILVAAVAALAQERFDMVVRNDFFAGFAGDAAALERAMKKTESVLAAEPKHAEALVWHGAGVFFSGGQAARQQDYAKAMELTAKGEEEMAAAVALAPENVGVLIPRGSVLLAGSRAVPAPHNLELLKTGLADYEKTWRLQSAYFSGLSGHARGELLFGLAEGYDRSGDAARARSWFEKLAAVDDPGNGHLAQAREYLRSGALNGPRGCVGCHTGK